jgi:HK97 family phage major capsid protein
MPTAKELREKRAPLGAEIRKLADKVNDENRDFKPEERTAWERVNAEFNDLTRQIEVQERAEQVGAALAERREQGPGREGTRTVSRQERIDRARKAERAQSVALQAWCLRQLDRPLTKRHLSACKLAGIRPGQRSLTIRLAPKPGMQVRAQGVSSTGIGGALVPQGFVNNLEKALKSFNAVRDSADVMRTETGAPMPWPTVNDTGNTGELIGENTAAAGQDATFAATTFNSYKFGSKMVQVGYELIEDSAIDLDAILGDLLGERIGRIQATYMTTGTGTAQPQGIVTGATLGVTAASPTAIASDELFNVLHSVDPAYRTDPSFGWQMHDNILLAVRKLKDSQGRYLWEPSLQVGQPDRLLKYPVFVNQSMASSIATTNKTILVGALGKYKVRDVNGVRLRRLVERFADADQVGFVAFLRSDGKLLNAGGNPIKYLQQA